MSDDDTRPPRKFASRKTVKALKKQRDPRWREMVREDLRRLAEDEAGLDLLAKAISAVLREKPRRPRRPRRRHKRHGDDDK